jgi:hypothetical protein
MRRNLLAALAILTASAGGSAANAATAVVTGTILTLSVDSNKNAPPEWVVFNLSTQPSPASTGCSAPAPYFAFSTTSVTDAATRKSMLALLLAAKVGGLSVLISYDNAGAYCDVSGYPAVYTIMLN